VDFLEQKEYWESMADRVVYTGAIDAYFGFCCGHLDYRSLRFDTQTLEGVSNFQGAAVVNYTDAATPYTRIVEHKHFEFGSQPDSVITYEYPQSQRMGDEPYYPINDAANMALYAKYQALAAALPHVIFGGRLAEYRYYDMDKVIESALERISNLWQ
jgi:UDP-galactopyranose mutase